MAREQFLCSAVGTDTAGSQRRFKITKLRGGPGFKIYNDKGHSSLSHGSLETNEQDIKREIGTVYDVVNVILDEPILPGLMAVTWPLSCPGCISCGCKPTRRRYGACFKGLGYCVACFAMIQRREAAKKWDKNQPDTWRYIYIDETTISSYSLAEFEIYRKEFIRQAELRISYLRQVEAKRTGIAGVSGTDIEDMREHVLKKA